MNFLCWCRRKRRRDEDELNIQTTEAVSFASIQDSCDNEATENEASGQTSVNVVEDKSNFFRGTLVY